MFKNLRSRVEGFNPINEVDFNHGNAGASASPTALPVRPPIRISKTRIQTLPKLLTLLAMNYTYINMIPFEEISPMPNTVYHLKHLMTSSDE
ncbi:MAG: hypothetical protein PHP51_08910 [Desulfotomaculaceae bacterium]|nr:hypothetical protein [Desulfotomaculaceae bacterium]